MVSDIPVHLLDLPGSVRGFITLGSDYEPIIVLNSRLSREQQKKTYKHEVKHLESGEMDNDGYDEYAPKAI